MTTEATTDATGTVDNSVTQTTGTSAAADKTAQTTTTTAEQTKPAAATLVDTTADDDKAPAVPQDWPADWREKLAAGDDKMAKRLARMGSPKALWDSYLNAEKKISSGQIKTPLPDKPTDEQLAAYRAENGIPEKPEGYEAKIEGFVFGDADKPLIESWQKYAHGKNYTPAQFNDALSWYAAEQEAMADRIAEADSNFRTQSVDALRQEWGAEYRPNLTAIKNMMASWPEGVADRIMGGRTADGRRIGDDPAFLGVMLAMQKELFPAASVVPAGTQNQAKAVGDRIAEINAIMASDDADAKYWKNPAVQAEYKQLIEAQERMNKRSA